MSMLCYMTLFSIITLQWGIFLLSPLNTSDFVFIKVGTKNSTSQPFVGHTWIWCTHQKQELNSYLEGRLVNAHQITGWVNSNLYVAMKEVLGILPIPDDVQISSRMWAYVSLSELKKHHFLAKIQGTCKAVLPAHAKAEKTCSSH